MTSFHEHHMPSRRQFLRVGSSLLALPWLESLAGAAAASDRPRRLVAICNNFGFYGPAFFPTDAGENYKPSEYLSILDDLRSKFTVFSGISHPDIGGDHASESCFLTSAKRPTAPGFRNSVLGHSALSPADLEREFGLTGGDIFHGALTPDQLFSARPLLGHADYRGPIKGLYHCGSGAHPGGGVTGAPGYNAAREMIRDLK